MFGVHQSGILSLKRRFTRAGFFTKTELEFSQVIVPF